LNAGARFIHGRVARVRRDGPRFLLQAPTELAADFLVAADGAQSVARRDLVGPIPRSLLTMTVGWFVRAQSDAAYTWFLPKPGYVWAFPRDDHLCLGGGSSDPSLDMWTEADRLRRAQFPDAPILQKWAAPIPFIRDASFYKQPTSGPGFAAIGDAAGHVDALTGEGILYALWDGMLLAQALIAGRPEGYEQAWREAYGAELTKAAELSRWFYDPATVERVFGLARRSPTMQRFLMDMMTDQPSYLATGRLFWKKVPRIAAEALGSLVKRSGA
jgi:flavin-dependent dehydrogenase